MSPISTSCTQGAFPWAPLSDGRLTAADQNRPATDRRTEEIRVRLIGCHARVQEQEDGPAVLRLVAKSLAAAGRELDGRASLLRGPHSEEAWRQRLRGDGRAFSLCDEARLVVHPAREAHAAVLALTTELLRPLGYQPARINDDPLPRVEAAVLAALRGAL